MAVRLGIDAKIYYTPLIDPLGQTPFDPPTPTTPFPASGLPTDTANDNQVMLELTNVKNVTLTIDTAEADVTTRATEGWRASVPVLKNSTVDFTMLWDAEDASFANVQEAFNQRTYIHLAILDGDATTSTSGYRIQGLYAPFSVMNCSRNETLEDALTATVSVKPANVSGYAPEWVDREM